MGTRGSAPEPDAAGGPDARVGLALERTLLAWVRTGVSLVALGVVLAKFVLFLHKLGLSGGGHGGVGTRRLGIGLVAAGGAVVCVAGMRHLRAWRHWRRGEPLASSPFLAMALVVVVALAATYAIFSIVAP